jgi:hypothetical protein
MGISIWHVVIVLTLFVLPNLPALWVMKKAGWSRWHFLILILPLANLVWLWIFAFSDWKRVPET